MIRSDYKRTRDISMGIITAILYSLIFWLMAFLLVYKLSEDSPTKRTQHENLQTSSLDVNTSRTQTIYLRYLRSDPTQESLQIRNRQDFIKVKKLIN